MSITFYPPEEFAEGDTIRRLGGQDHVTTTDPNMSDTMTFILTELRITNFHLAIMSDNDIKPQDLETM